MTNRSRRVFALALITLAVPALAQEPTPITDPDAYALYAQLVPPAWARLSKDPLLLQRETAEIVRVSCGGGLKPPNEDWRAVFDNFRQENAGVRLLQPILPIETPYRLISRAEIEADDARLAVKYPGTWMRRPESIEYAAVSAVGFNAAKTKAVVYVRFRSQGGLYTLEKRDGTWIKVFGSCVWIA